MLTLMLIFVPEDKETLKYMQEPFGDRIMSREAGKGGKQSRMEMSTWPLKNVIRLCVCFVSFFIFLPFNFIAHNYVLFLIRKITQWMKKKKKKPEKHLGQKQLKRGAERGPAEASCRKITGDAVPG